MSAFSPSPWRQLASSALLGAAMLAASPLAQASGEYVLSGMVRDGDRCTTVRSTSVDVITTGRPDLNRTLRKAYRAGIDRELVLEGGITSLSVWGNVDLASRIQLLGISGASLRERDRHGGGPNGSRGCDTRGSVDLEITLPGLPTTTTRGRLRFEFRVGNAFEIPVVLKPFPERLTLSWPAQAVSGEQRGEHFECLRSNGGSVRVDGNTLEIAINPDNPLPTSCNVFQFAYHVPTDDRDIPSNCLNASSRSVTEVTGVPANNAFAQGQTRQPLNACGSRAEARNGRIPAFRIDYAGAVAALRAPRLNLANVTAARDGSFQRSGPQKFQPTATPQPGSRAPAAPVEFSVVLARYNNLSDLHPPMKVRITEAKAAARSNIQADLTTTRLCGNDRSVLFRDRSTSDLAIRSRQLDLGDGTRRSSVEPINLTHTYSRQGSYTVVLTVTDANNVSQQSRKTVIIPQSQSGCDFSSGGGGTVTTGSGNGPNLLPVLASPNSPLLRRIGGLGSNVMIPIVFCSKLSNNQAIEVSVPDLVWGISSAGERSDSARVELRDANSGAVLSGFDSGSLNANDAAVTRNNYPGRPTRVRVVNVTGGDTMKAYGNQTGCFLDKAAPAPRLDPPFLLVVDPQNRIAEGPDSRTAEADNELRF